MPRFFAAFWLLSLVRRLLLKNTRIIVLFLPRCCHANGVCFTWAGFLQRLLQVADIAYIKELFHIRWFKELISRQL